MFAEYAISKITVIYQSVCRRSDYNIKLCRIRYHVHHQYLGNVNGLLVAGNRIIQVFLRTYFTNVSILTRMECGAALGEYCVAKRFQVRENVLVMKVIYSTQK